MTDNFDSIEARINRLLTAEIFEDDFGGEQELQEFDDPTSRYEVMGNIAILLRDIYLELKEIRQAITPETPAPKVTTIRQRYSAELVDIPQEILDRADFDQLTKHEIWGLMGLPDNGRLPACEFDHA